MLVFRKDNQGAGSGVVKGVGWGTGEGLTRF